MKNVNRRVLRRKLGTRSARRAGTKSKAIPGAKEGGRGKSGHDSRRQQFRHPRHLVPRPRVQLEKLVRETQREAAIKT